ncbi:MAG: RNA-binding S4 domain-containing protein [Chromatiales bacterium]|nr:RNA-binding S4 domain-containing protein [Chromatiales bacterium]
MSEDEGRVRLDKWLWAARFYKTRALATEAISGGKVHLNESRVKPARPVHEGDRVRIRKGEVEWEIRVRKLSARRGPATEATLLYEETEGSVARREQEAGRRLLLRQNQSDGGRPTKQSRRRIVRFTRKGEVV